MGTLARLFLSSPVHCRQLLDTLVQGYTHDTLHAELRGDMEAFAATIARRRDLTADPEYRRAHDDVQRLRRHLQQEADRAEDGRRELATLRAELSTKTAVIAALRVELNHTTIPVLEAVDGDTRDAHGMVIQACG
jgi:chromosome segregation ATPase